MVLLQAIDVLLQSYLYITHKMCMLSSSSCYIGCLLSYSWKVGVGSQGCIICQGTDLMQIFFLSPCPPFHFHRVFQICIMQLFVITLSNLSSYSVFSWYFFFKRDYLGFWNFNNYFSNIFQWDIFVLIYDLAIANVKYFIC